MKLFKINTTAFEEEDFFIVTDLSEEQINEAIKLIVIEERDGGKTYCNDDLTDYIKYRYPNNFMDYFTEIETISI